MKKSDKVALEMSEKRQAINALLAKDELTDDERGELDTLTKRAQECEVEYRAALVAEPDPAEETTEREPDSEMKERIELRSKASLGNYLLAAAQGRMVSGAEHELCAAAGVTGIPIELWDVPETRADGPERETRAVTGAPATVGVNLDPIRPAVFANSIAPRLGIEMPRVSTGTYATGTITGSQSAEAKGKSDAIDATAGAITVTTAVPKRVSARLELTLEDIAAVGQANFETMLRQNLSLALSDELDDQAINGNGTAPNLAGIFHRLTNPSAPGSDLTDFDDFVMAFADGIDGLWANTVKDVAIVAGVDTYKLSARTFRDASGTNPNDLGDMAFTDYAMAHYGGWWTNKRMPAAVSNIQQAILYRKGRSAMGASGGMRTAVCPHWGEVGIDDVYSGSARAERYFTLHVLLGDVILVQPDAYAEVSFRTAV